MFTKAVARTNMVKRSEAWRKYTRSEDDVGRETHHGFGNLKPAVVVSSE